MKKQKRIFSGNTSVEMWSEINSARTVKDLRRALYSVGCKLQEFEERMSKKRSAVQHMHVHHTHSYGSSNNC